MLVEQLTRSKFIHNKEKAALRKMTTVRLIERGCTFGKPTSIIFHC